MLYVWAGSAVFTAIAGYTDLKAGRIRNWLIVAMLTAGFGYHLWNHTLLLAVEGLGFGLTTLILHLCNVFGEGDVKLMAALGSLVGPTGVLFVLGAMYLFVWLYWLWALFFNGNATENLRREWRIVCLHGLSLFYLVGGLRFAKVRETMEQIKAAQADSPTVPYGVFVWLGVVSAVALVAFK